MPNAKDAKIITAHRIFMLGDSGSGKTTQFQTLPGKKFAYLFDANALLSLRGSDVDYEEFLPDRLNLAATSLAKGKGDIGAAKTSSLYNDWEKDFDSKLQQDFFKDYSWIMLDSATTFLDLIMDRILSINGRFGQWPQQDDYGPQMIAFTNVCRSLTGLGKGVYMTGHLDMRQDELTKRIYRKPMMTGRLTTKIPLLFSDVFVAEAENDGSGNVSYKIQTVPDRTTVCVRTAIRGLAPFENVTVDFKKELPGQGLGKLILADHA